MLDRLSQSQAMKKEGPTSPKLKFPLLKGDDSLDNLLNDMLGKDGKKKLQKKLKASANNDA